MVMEFQYNDGGRIAAGYKGTAGDCVVRAISIVLELPYKTVYDELTESKKKFANGRSKAAKQAAKNKSVRNGIHREVYHSYLLGIGMKWIATMQIGQGCKVHLDANELPSGRIIVSLSKHLAAVINGVLHDTYDCTRKGARCVYGYYTW